MNTVLAGPPRLRPHRPPMPDRPCRSPRSCLAERACCSRRSSDEDAHELVMRGLPAAAMVKLFAVLTLSTADVLEAIGVSERSYARRKAAPKTRLPVGESERVWRFAEVVAHATRVFGSQAEAESRLNRPAIGLDQRKPIDLLRTHPGARLVQDYLTRIEHGVYS